MTLPLEKATYRALANSTPILFGKSKNGNTQIAIGFEIVDMDDETGTHRPSGEMITWIGNFGANSEARTIEALIHCGWQGEDPSELSGSPGSSMLPNVIDLVCEPEEYEGKWTLKANWINKPGAGRFAFKESLAENDLRAFGAQLKSKVKAIRASGGAPRRTSGGGTGGGGSPPREGRGDFGGYGSRNGSAQHPNAPGGPRDRDDDIPF